VHDQNHTGDLSGPTDQSAVIARLQARLARERAARLEAEAIAEQVTSDRWELRQQLQDKLALRTAELEAARQTAARALSEQERFASVVSHDFRTTLAALFFLVGSLSPDQPPSAQQLTELSDLLSELRAIMDTQVSASNAAGDDGEPGSDSRSEVLPADVVSANEDNWHEAAARSGKLLILGIENRTQELSADQPEDINRAVLAAISDRSETAEPVIELHLKFGPEGFAVS
jgi:signal transduction histidine kinase